MLNIAKYLKVIARASVESVFFKILLKAFQYFFHVLTSSSTDTKSKLFFAKKKEKQKHIENGKLFITFIKVIKTYKTFLKYIHSTRLKHLLTL